MTSISRRQISCRSNPQETSAYAKTPEDKSTRASLDIFSFPSSYFSLAKPSHNPSYLSVRRQQQ